MKKEFKIYKTNFNEYTLEAKTNEYFYNIEKLDILQLNTIFDILILNGYTDTSDNDNEQ